jgi:hypothetical protein
MGEPDALFRVDDSAQSNTHSPIQREFSKNQSSASYLAVQSLRWREEGILSILRYLVTVRRATG